MREKTPSLGRPGPPAYQVTGSMTRVLMTEPDCPLSLGRNRLLGFSGGEPASRVGSLMIPHRPDRLSPEDGPSGAQVVWVVGPVVGNRTIEPGTSPIPSTSRQSGEYHQNPLRPRNQQPPFSGV